MRLRILAAVIAVCTLAAPAFAQEQHGAIEGVVKDSSGAVLPGVTVHLTGGSGVSVDATTDSTGLYRFPSVLPGTYTVTTNLSGFRPGKVENVTVTLGELKKVDFSLAVASVSENVEVTAAPPVVDVKQSTAATNINAERIALIPHGNNFTNLITQAPGANDEPKSGGISIDGASAAENRYVVDGVETTSIYNGLSAKPVLSNFVDEVQIKSSGYSAEYGGSTGAVVNVITKSGTNAFSGTALEEYQGSALNGTCRKPSLAPVASKGATSGSTPLTLTDNSPQPCGVNPNLRLQLTNSNTAEFWTFPKDKWNENLPGGSLGGPIFQNKAWFFAGYQPDLTTTVRSVSAKTSGNQNAASASATQHEQVHNLTADQTMQLGSKLRTRVAFNNSWDKVNGQLPNQSGTDPLGTNYARGSVKPNWSVSGQADYTITSNLLASVRAGYFRQNEHSFGIPTDTRFTFTQSNIGTPGVPDNEQHATNFSNIPTNSAVAFDLLQRKFIQADATWFTHAAGEHQIKGGVQADLRGDNINSGNLGQTISLNWGSQFSADAPQGTFGYYQLNSNAAFPREGFITQGNVASNVIGLFLQDTWSATSRLTLNLGVRTENEKVPSFTSVGNDYGKYPIQFGFGDKIAPRLGAAYDLFGDGRWKVSGDWGIFYDIFKLDLAQQSFGGAKWIAWYFTLDTPNWETINQNQNCPPDCSGTFIASSNERLPSLSNTTCEGPCIDPGIKPMRSQEASVMLEHELTSNSSVSVRYVHKQLDRAIDDTGSIVPFTIDPVNGPFANDEPYIIGNPGENISKTFNIINCNAGPGVPTCDVYAGSSGQYVNPKAKRNYDAAEFKYQKRFSHDWAFYGTYTLSRLYGNYSGLSNSDENGRVDPNIERTFDYPIEAFGGNGKPLYGDLATDRTHQLKAQLTYSFPFGTTIGINQSALSGIPITRQVPVFPGHGYILFFDGRGSDGRLPWLTQTDLYVQQAFKLGKSGRTFIVDATVLNLFDQRTITNYDGQVRRTGTDPTIDEAAFFAGQVNTQALIDSLAASSNMKINPRFMDPSGWQAPLQARFGLKFTF